MSATNKQNINMINKLNMNKSKSINSSGTHLPTFLTSNS